MSSAERSFTKFSVWKPNKERLEQAHTQRTRLLTYFDGQLTLDEISNPDTTYVVRIGAERFGRSEVFTFPTLGQATRRCEQLLARAEAIESKDRVTQPTFNAVLIDAIFENFFREQTIMVDNAWLVIVRLTQHEKSYSVHVTNNYANAYSITGQAFTFPIFQNAVNFYSAVRNSINEPNEDVNTLDLVPAAAHTECDISELFNLDGFVAKVRESRKQKPE